MSIADGCFLAAFLFTLLASYAAIRARNRVLHHDGEAWANKMMTSTFIGAMIIPVALACFGLGRISA